MRKSRFYEDWHHKHHYNYVVSHPYNI